MQRIEAIQIETRILSRLELLLLRTMRADHSHSSAFSLFRRDPEEGRGRLLQSEVVEAIDQLLKGFFALPLRKER